MSYRLLLILLGGLTVMLFIASLTIGPAALSHHLACQPVRR
jgi:hypothetical protein